jgi:hypothetical protein
MGAIGGKVTEAQVVEECNSMAAAKKKKSAVTIQRKRYVDSDESDDDWEI